MLTVNLLGMPTFVLNNQPVSHLIRGRAAALLIYLAVTRQPQPRAQVADLLWENMPEQQAKANLRYRLSDLRQVVGDYIVASGDTLAFNQEFPHWVDATVFTTYMGQAAMLSAPTPAARAIEPAILQELLKLYRGEFLAGFLVDKATAFESWLMVQRRCLHDLMVQGLQWRTQQHLTQGEYAEGLVLNHQLLTLEPWREEAHRQRMLLLTYSGQRSAALQQYTRCCQILTEELDVSPMPETTALYEAIKAGQSLAVNQVNGHHHTAAASLPFLAEPPASSQNRTISPTPPAASQFDLGAMPAAAHFYGRQTELATLHSWIGQEQSRLVTLLGLPGQGKTALAATFVQEIMEHEQSPTHGFTNVIWRSLQNAPTCVEILQGWLQLLDTTPCETLTTSFDDLATRLFTILQTRRCLLILDGVDRLFQNPGAESTGNMEAYRSTCEAYTQLFGLFFQRRHRGCLLLTSRCRPVGLTQLDERNRAFHCLNLGGLSLTDSATLLAAHRISGDCAIHQQLHHHYAGNPLLVNQAANLIHECFDGDGTAFVRQGVYFLGDIGMALAQQIANLSPLEQQLLHALAQANQSLSHQALWMQLTPVAIKRDYFHALQRLQRAFLVQLADEQVKLAPLARAYLAEHAMSDAANYYLAVNRAVPQ